MCKLYGLWNYDEKWFTLATSEIFWTEHKPIAEAQLIKVRQLFNPDRIWQVLEIGEDGAPVFEFEPLEWDYEVEHAGTYINSSTSPMGTG